VERRSGAAVSPVLVDHVQRVWVGWLRFEFRAIAILLPTVCLEMVLLLVLTAHLPLLISAVGTLPALLAPSVWRFATEIGTVLPQAGVVRPR
jgi:hypothetical protein